MATELLTQSDQRHSDQPTSEYSLPSNSDNTPRETNCSDQVTNHTGSHDPIAVDSSLPMDVEGACNESQALDPATVASEYANNRSTATNSVTRPYASPGETGVTPDCGRESSVEPTAEDIQHYIPYIDKLLMAADLERKAIRELIQQRFQEALERGPLAGSFDARERGCPSPAHGSSQSHHHAKDTASEIHSTPKVVKPQKVIIDLTDIPEDSEPVRSPSPAQSPQSPGNKRKRNDSASKSNTQSDRERDPGPPIKRRRLADSDPTAISKHEHYLPRRRGEQSQGPASVQPVLQQPPAPLQYQSQGSPPTQIAGVRLCGQSLQPSLAPIDARDRSQALRSRENDNMQLVYILRGGAISGPPYITGAIDRHALRACSLQAQPRPFIILHPIIVIASFLTTIKSTWELSCIVREKRAAKTLKTEAKSTYFLLQRAYSKRLLLEREFDSLFERLIRIEAHNDHASLHAILELIERDCNAGLTRTPGRLAGKRAWPAGLVAGGSTIKRYRKVVPVEAPEEQSDATLNHQHFVRERPGLETAVRVQVSKDDNSHGTAHGFRKSTITIGRSAPEQAEQDPDIDLGPNKLISQQHVLISFNVKIKQWSLVVKGRNAVKVDGMPWRFGQCILQSGNVIEIGGIKLGFIELDPSMDEFEGRGRATVEAGRFLRQGCCEAGMSAVERLFLPYCTGDERTHQEAADGILPPQDHSFHGHRRVSMAASKGGVVVPPCPDACDAPQTPERSGSTPHISRGALYDGLHPRGSSRC
ncbi:Fork head protein 2 [Madurella mycetomatis]|uniref:Fork head protein 2 n=1 Tax=Madurella mycetomatis TaxID=100816 RepID=A0A175VUU0_9PEZI|nr:Fork head protein 2 [Madurella mycetomatis]